VREYLDWSICPEISNLSADPNEWEVFVSWAFRAGQRAFPCFYDCDFDSLLLCVIQIWASRWKVLWWLTTADTALHLRKVRRNFTIFCFRNSPWVAQHLTGGVIIALSDRSHCRDTSRYLSLLSKMARVRSTLFFCRRHSNILNSFSGKQMWVHKRTLPRSRNLPFKTNYFGLSSLSPHAALIIGSLLLIDTPRVNAGWW
jgi:hypothetical protein